MQIKITGHGIKITPPLRDYVQEKISKLEEFFANIQKVEVVLDARSTADTERRQVVEIRAWMAGLTMIQAREGGRDMYAAFDLALEEAKHQIERHKEKVMKEPRRKAEKIKQRSREIPPPKAESGPAIVKLNRIARKIMSYEEARAELNSMKQEFLAFRNAENNEVNVIRKDRDDFELLRPEKEMTTDQAIEELKRSEKNLLIFNNPETNCSTIIFQRKSGNFGLIEPEL